MDIEKMQGMKSKQDYAENNRESRLEAYFTGTVWAAIGGIGPVGCFVCNNLLNVPEPISVTYLGEEHSMHPYGGTYSVYDYEWASTGDHALNILGFVIGFFAAIAIALLFYCIARFLADPIMYRIDLRYDKWSPKAEWLKRSVMAIVILLYCGTMVFAGIYEKYQDDQYVWLVDNEGTYHRVDKTDYEKYMNKETDESDHAKKETKETEKTTEATTEPTTTEDLSKTPVERGYPSNDLQYYIDHPNEPMPQELINGLNVPEEYYGYP